MYAFPSYKIPGPGDIPEVKEGEKEEEKLVQTNADLKWTVVADLGELDDHATMYREFDKDYSTGGAKISGWTNPLSWTDNGNDDDVVLFQLKEKMKFDESGFETPADKGIDDDSVVNYV